MNCEGRYNPCRPLQMACDITNTTQPQCIEADQICDGMLNCPNQHDELVRPYLAAKNSILISHNLAMAHFTSKVPLCLQIAW